MAPPPNGNVPDRDPNEDTKLPTLIVVTGDGREIFGARAVMFVLVQTGWRAPLMRLPGTRSFFWTVNAGYRAVANNRQVFFPASSSPVSPAAR